MTIALIICIIGGIVYLIANRLSAGDVAELGRICFFAGLLAFLLAK